MGALAHLGGGRVELLAAGAIERVAHFAGLAAPNLFILQMNVPKDINEDEGGQKQRKVGFHRLHTF